MPESALEPSKDLEDLARQTLTVDSEISSLLMVEVRALSNHEVRFCRIPPLGFNLDVMPCPSAQGNFFLYV